MIIFCKSKDSEHRAVDFGDSQALGSAGSGLFSSNSISTASYQIRVQMAQAQKQFEGGNICERYVALFCLVSFVVVLPTPSFDIAKANIIQLWTALSRRTVDVERLMKYATLAIENERLAHDIYDSLMEACSDDPKVWRGKIELSLLGLGNSFQWRAMFLFVLSDVTFFLFDCFNYFIFNLFVFRFCVLTPHSFRRYIEKMIVPIIFLLQLINMVSFPPFFSLLLFYFSSFLLFFGSLFSFSFLLSSTEDEIRMDNIVDSFNEEDNDGRVVPDSLNISSSKGNAGSPASWEDVGKEEVTGLSVVGLSFCGLL
jgi:hypothetical protein